MRASEIAEVFELRPTSESPSGGMMQWMVRLGALGIGGLLVFGLLGQCAKP